MRGRWVRRWVAATLLACVAVTLAGCGDDDAVVSATAVAPADLLLRPAQLPSGFATTQLTVSDLVDSDRAQLAAARADGVVPQECRPTADTSFTEKVGESNSAVLAASAADVGLVELVSTVRRDIDDDIRTRSGQCRTTRTTVASGSLAGATVTTESTTLPDPPEVANGPDGLSVERAFLSRSDVSTALPDSTVRKQVGYVGYALVKRAGGAVFTVALTVNGPAGRAQNPPADAVEPMPSSAFVDLFGTALSAAAR
ncbi:hypothetical protein RND64_03215 [Gordonia sp. w5E2]|uniref:DUF5642 domain-containing protein n=1 Tax=Gordonia jacobaea TaxID=122202 RepID=A0ABR5IFH0_9ACTN|nr:MULTISPECIES: hypothetical protein [Gordonia]KNA92410.1 hypothetical protein ABW18_03455 [Gordonia jacobaea]